MTKEVMKLAIEALNTPRPSDSYPPLWRTYENTINTAIKALEEALKQEQGEPLTENGIYRLGYHSGYKFGEAYAKANVKPKEWVGLTDEEIEQIYMDTLNFQQNARALEAKLKEKNT